MTHPTVSTNSAAAPAPAPADAPSPVQIVYVQLPDPISALPSGMFMVLGNDGSALSTPLLAAGEAVSVFPSDADVVVAIDPAALPANGGPVTIWMEDADGNQTLLATFVPGPDPMFVIIQSGNLDAGIRYTVTISGTNVIGHYP